MATTYNLATGKERTYTLPADQAVIAAYAQEHRDWNTWGYAKRHRARLVFGSCTVCCGNWTAIINA